MVILAFGLRLALNAGSRKQTRKMSLDEKHDYALYFYHRHGRKNAVLGNFYLVICAQADVCQRKYELAEQALEEGRVFEIPLKESIPERRICMLYDTKREIGAAGRRFREMVVTRA